MRYAVFVVMATSIVVSPCFSQTVIYSDDFESDLSRWEVEGHGCIVEDPLDPTNMVLSFTGTASGGNIWSDYIDVNRNTTYVLSFRYLGNAGGADTGGYLWLWDPEHGFSSLTHIWGTQPYNCEYELIDDGIWHTYELVFTIPELFDPSSGMIQITAEDWNGSGSSDPPPNIAGDALFDDILLTQAARPMTNGYWRFEEGVADEIAFGDNSIIDQSENGSHGTPHGSPTYSNDVPSSYIPLTCQPNYLSLEFSSPDDEVMFKSMFPFHVEGDATVEFYIKVHGGSYGCILWSRYGNNDYNRYNIQYGNDYTLTLDYRNPNTPLGDLHNLIVDIPMTIDDWHHLAFVRSGNAYSLYMDGSVVGGGDDQIPDLPYFVGWAISGRNYARVNGYVDEVRFTTRALAPREFLIGFGGGPESMTISDVPGDEGGFLECAWEASLYDQPGHDDYVTCYYLQRDEIEGWSSIATVPATQSPSYEVTVATPDIFTIGQPEPFSQYRVLAQSSDPDKYYYSQVDSAYSLDNLPPPIPVVTLYEDIHERVITWEIPDIPDYDIACVFRGSIEGFIPDDPLVCPDIPFYLESHLVSYYYRVQFTDTHGNAGEFSEELHSQYPTDIGPSSTVAKLYQCSPNPFNPMTSIRFSLPEQTAVRLCVYDVAGRLVDVLVEQRAMEPGWHDVTWSGQDESGQRVSAGVYFYRLETGGFLATKRMTLVK